MIMEYPVFTMIDLRSNSWFRLRLDSVNITFYFYRDGCWIAVVAVQAFLGSRQISLDLTSIFSIPIPTPSPRLRLAAKPKLSM